MHLHGHVRGLVDKARAAGDEAPARMSVRVEIVREIEVRKDNAHPCGDDAPGRDDPGLGLVVIWWGEPPLGDPAEEPGESVDKDVGDDAGDDAVCNAIGGIVRLVVNNRSIRYELVSERDDDQREERGY